MTLTLHEALDLIRAKLAATQQRPAVESSPLDEACGRVLAEDAIADRDYPPFPRSARDGFAVRSSDLESGAAVLEIEGEVRAGQQFQGTLARGQCVSIMTGAPVPDGTDAVVMVEQTRVEGSRVSILKSVKQGENVVAKGSEAAAGSVVISAGRRLGPGEIALLAALGCAQVRVFRQARVGIVTTGDELVPVAGKPEWFQIRDSNTALLRTLVSGAGGIPHIASAVADQPEALTAEIERILGRNDLLLLSGGVSAGKYDFVRPVLADMGAEFYFEGVSIRPGKPLVFGNVGGKFFFGLPGNPVSALVTFQLFARPALLTLLGAAFEEPLFLRAQLEQAVLAKPGFTAFVPARVRMTVGGPVARAVRWEGSGDLVGLAVANCFLVLRPDQQRLVAGDSVEVLCKPEN